MSAVAFDPLEYARQLEAAGLPRPQAEVIAKGLTTMFIHNFDTLVTKDYLETRLETLEYRMEAKVRVLLTEAFTSKNPGYAKIESRFDQMDGRFDRMDDRLGRMDDRFTDIDVRLNSIDVRFARVNVMLGIILAAVAVPILQLAVTLFM
ncbi:MAG: hypothetical protein ABJK20_08985 [Halieaceae bacterium]